MNIYPETFSNPDLPVFFNGSKISELEEMLESLVEKEGQPVVSTDPIYSKSISLFDIFNGTNNFYEE